MADIDTFGVIGTPSPIAAAACSIFSNSAVTTAVVAKADPGNLYGFLVNGGTPGNFLQFINAAATPVLGTAALFSIQIPASGILTVLPASIALANFPTTPPSGPVGGISVGISTTYNGASAGTAAAVVIFYI